VEVDGGHPLRVKVKRVAAASAVALAYTQVVSLAQAVTLARVLSPHELGVFAAGTILIAFLDTVAEGGLRTALIQRDDRVAEASETVFWGTLATGAVMSLGALGASPAIGHMFHSRLAGLIAAAVAPIMFLSASTSVPNALLQRAFSVRRRMIVGPTVGTTFAVSSVAAALLGMGVWSLVVGTYLQYAALFITSWVLVPWRPGRARPSYQLWREMARFGFPLTGGQLVGRTQGFLKTVITGRFLGAAALGQLRYGERLARIPFMAVLEIGAYALLPAFARVAKDPPRLRSTFLASLRWGTIGVAGFTALLMALGEPAVVLLLGERWRDAGLVAAATAGLGLGSVFNTTAAEAIKGAGRTRLINWQTGTDFGVSLALLLVLIGPLGLVGVGLTVSVTALTVGVVMLIVARRVVGVSGRTILALVAPSLTAMLAAAASTAALDRLVIHSDQHDVAVGLALIAVESLFGATVYLATLTLLDRKLLTELVGVVRRLRRGRSSGSDTELDMERTETARTDGQGKDVKGPLG
jgi:PST family polysaccharide transporter